MLRPKVVTVVASTLAIGLSSPLAARAATSPAAIEARLRALEVEMGKLRREAREARAQANKAQAHAAKTTNVANASHAAVDPQGLPPVFVSFKNGIFVETADKAYSFKVGGRIMVDGGGITQPLNGFANQIGFRQVRLEVEGKAAYVWFYKLQYDFAGTGQITGNNQVVGGIRDFYIGMQHPALTLPFAKDPVFIMVGNQFEPFSIESSSSSKYRSFIERAMAVEGIAPNRHIGVAMGAYGDNWSAKVGVFSTSPEDASLNPAQNARGLLPPAGAPGSLSTGGGQYVDVAGRATYAPIKEADELLHIGASARYHAPNDATGLSDDRVLRPGNRLRSEATILGQGLLGAPDLSCGSFAVNPLFNGGAASSSVAGHCTRDVFSYGVEVAAAHGPFDMQAEYLGTHYNRDMSKILQARASGVFAPGGSSLFFNGYYVYGRWWLTGESRATAYQVSDKAGANFFEPKILHPVSAGGLGAFGLVARYSAINLNSGPYSGTGLANMLGYTTTIAPNPQATALIANAGVAGGRQENVTTGFDWYPDKGVHLQFNWTHVLHVSAPLNDYNALAFPTGVPGGLLPGRQGFYMNGAHPDLFEARAQVYW